MRDETVLFNPAGNQFCVLNKTAAFVWEHLREPSTAEQICTALSAAFINAEGAQVARDVDSVLTSMELSGCITKSR